MSDNDQILNADLDTLTDDQIMSLDPSQVQSLMEEEGSGDVGEENPPEESDSNDGNADVIINDDPSDDTVQDDDSSKPKEEDDPKPEDTSEPNSGIDPKESATPSEPSADDPKGEDTSKGDSEPSDAKAAKKEEEPKTEDDPKKSENVEDKSNVSELQSFHDKITAPFKADGKDIQVRSPEDAIRLMQMGANYSRRMEQLKPVKAINQMLEPHGLNDPAKLSFLIDINNGNIEAIQQLLKEKNIDPLNLNTSDESTYQKPNYEVDGTIIAFKDAIDTTMQLPGGPELIQDINSNWDDQSKEALKAHPEIFENLLAQRSTDVYDKINTELAYQRSLGYLNGVPFLQAYHMVGDAMQKQGVFNSENKAQSGGQDMLNRQDPAPIDTGTRKAETPENTQPNPDLSTPSSRAAPSGDGTNVVTDYNTLSDEDFLNMTPPD